jgi:hypothetical protein
MIIGVAVKVGELMVALLNLIAMRIASILF